MKIAVDARGGDHAPGEVVAGAGLAADQLRGEIILVGREECIRSELEKHQVTASNIIVHHADEVVEMDDSPRTALRQKANSSMDIAVQLVRDKEAHAALSAGNSGAFMALATMRLRLIPGVDRPPIAIALPTPNGKRVCLDAGANVDCKPQHLAEFALMGSQYAEHALGIANPKVGLLSIGTEQCKGNDLTLAAFPLLERLPINFIGNVEGTQLFTEDVDVTVCDGFVGNVVLKIAEGVAQLLTSQLKSCLRSNIISQAGAMLVGPSIKPLRELFDYAEYGGALLLGVNGVCVVSHGKSDRRAIAAAIRVAAQAVEGKVCENMAASFERMFVTPG